MYGLKVDRAEAGDGIGVGAFVSHAIGEMEISVPFVDMEGNR